MRFPSTRGKYLKDPVQKNVIPNSKAAVEVVRGTGNRDRLMIEAVEKRSS